jgi:hypothetical protein
MSTAQGILCGNRQKHGRDKVYHQNADAVFECQFGRTRSSAPAAPATPTPSRSVREVSETAEEDDARRRQPLLQQNVEQQVYVEVGGTLYQGTFTVVFADGSHRTLKVKRQAEDAEFKPGQLIVSYLSGSDNDHDYTHFGHVWEKNGRPERLYIWRKYQGRSEVIEAAKVLCMDPQAAAAAYSVASERCSAAGCNRTLTAPVEENPYRAYGLGPDCGARLLGPLG